MEYSIVMG